MDGRSLAMMAIVQSVLLWHVVLRADEPVDGRSGRTAKGGEHRILVLTDGQVLKTPFVPRPDGYDVQVPGGRMFVESERVRFVARDMTEAWERYRETYQTLTPDVHLEIARWCLANGLRKEAREEVLDALKLDPNRVDARRMLESLVREPSAPKASTGVTTYAPLIKPDVVPEARSLAGLSRDVAQEFVRHVQPLMMNKCANGGCHGPSSDTGFRLSSSRSGSQPLIAERNLAAVLKQIDVEDPDRSRLLSVLNEQHAGMTTPIFRGRSGTVQQQVLRKWVESVAADIAPEAARRRTRQAAIEAEETAEVVRASATKSSERKAPLNESAHGVVRADAESEEEFLESARAANAADAFDPNEFNRKYGTKPSESLEDGSLESSELNSEVPESDSL